MAIKVWNRDLKLEARAKTHFMYRVGFLLGVITAWAAVALTQTTLPALTLMTVVAVGVLTVWDMWKMWRGKQSVIN